MLRKILVGYNYVKINVSLRLKGSPEISYNNTRLKHVVEMHLILYNFNISEAII